MALTLLLLLYATALAQPAVTLVDRAVAVAGERVITESEVRIALALAALEPGAVPVLAPPLGGDVDGLERWWLDQVVLRQLAGDVEVYQPASGEVRERVERLLAATDPDELARLQRALGLDRTGIDAWIYNRLVVERFVLRNLGSWSREQVRPEIGADDYQRWLAEVRSGVAVRRIGLVHGREPGQPPPAAGGR